MQTRAAEIRVSIDRQTLELLQGEKVVRCFRVSTSKFGEGCEPGSYKTPLGRFFIAQKIGDGAAAGEVFKARVSLGRIGREDEADDHVQTRILWLAGRDQENQNTRERYVYIHGTNHESEIGTKASHGCVRMRNAEIIELYDLVDEGTAVRIDP